MFCSYYRTKQKDTPIPDTAAKSVDMPHTNRPYKSSYRYRRYCHFPRISSSFLLCAYIIAFLRCRFGKETGAGQYRPAWNLDALLLMEYNKSAKKHLWRDCHEKQPTTKRYSVFGHCFLLRLCRQFADSEALYHADAGAHDLCVRRVFDLTENAWLMARRK